MWNYFYGCILVAIALQIYISFPGRVNQPDNANPGDFINLLCSEQDVVNYVQKRQLRAARLELFQNDHRLYHDETSLFYDHNYGVVKLQAELEKNKLAPQLSYYRIWKAGNDNIRAHLRNFTMYCQKNEGCKNKYNRGNASKSFCIQSCTMDSLISADVKAAVRESNRQPFSFTFVRDPIARFISGYTEVEYRMKSWSIAPVDLPLYAEVGTQDRFREFIRMILKSDASKSLLQEKNVQLQHIVPQIGTLMFVKTWENQKIQLYKLENFESEWQRLATDSGFLGLKEVYSSVQLAPHPTSNDPLKTTKAAKAFLGPALQRGDTFLTVEQQKKKLIAVKHMRALCRIYLVDFLCLSDFYKLPIVCQDLIVEAQELVNQHQHEHMLAAKMKLPGRMAFLLPSSVWTVYAELVCLFGPAHCVSDVLYGKNSGIDVD